MNKLSIILITLFTLFSFSCSKVESLITSNKEILQAHTWKFSSLKYEGKEALTECLKDETIHFLSDGTVLRKVGVKKCDIEQDNSNTTWTLSNDQKTLTMKGDFADGDFPIVELSDSILIYGTNSDILVTMVAL
jgi:hypothetical protein